MSRRRILFVSEAVTLAQVVRLYALARALPPAQFEVHFAAARFDDLVFKGAAFRRWPIESLSPAAIEGRVRAGRRLYGGRTLRRYLADDRRVIEAVRPHLVVGDLRLSLSVAAPLAGVPYASLINAYWSPHVRRAAFPLPEHPLVRLLGPRLAARHFPKALPHVLAHFAAPVNRLRRAHGLPPLGDLLDVLVYGDLVLQPDPPGLIPIAGAPAHHHLLGPVPWSPDVPLPPWWGALDPQRPTVYVTLGSSGRPELLPVVLRALAALGAQILVSTAGRGRPLDVPPRTFVADYLPGDAAAARADLVVSNGGSSTSYQALAAGKPVVGIAANLDQYLAMEAPVREGAAVLVRAGQTSTETIATAATWALGPEARRAAARLAPLFTTPRSDRAFRDLVDRVAA